MHATVIVESAEIWKSDRAISIAMRTMMIHSSRTERSTSMSSVSARAVSPMTSILALSVLAARLQLIFVFETRIEALEIGPVP